MWSLSYCMHRPQVSPCFVLCHQLSGKRLISGFPTSFISTMSEVLAGIALTGLAVLRRGEGSVYLCVLWMGELRRRTKTLFSPLGWGCRVTGAAGPRSQTLRASAFVMQNRNDVTVSHQERWWCSLKNACCCNKSFCLLPSLVDNI